MMRRNASPEKLSEQVERKVSKNSKEGYDLDPSPGNDRVVSTGSTLLDLAISGGRFPEGGIPTGILVEAFGPSGTGKTVLLCQIAANIQKMGGKNMFHDPEGRLNEQFARMFGLEMEKVKYAMTNTITEVFEDLRAWIPEKTEPGDPIYGIFADSLAALSTDMEMEKEEGDKMGMRRAKDLSTELRKTCRIIRQRDILVVCSNQIRQNPDAGIYGEKFRTPGGKAVEFYASLRLRFRGADKIKVTKEIKGKKHERVIGVIADVQVSKSSVWKPFRTADVYILFDYGIDDIRANLRFLKTNTGNSIYQVGDIKLGKSLEEAITQVEEDNLERKLKMETIGLWREIESQFKQERKPRQ